MVSEEAPKGQEPRKAVPSRDSEPLAQEPAPLSLVNSQEPTA